MSFKLQKLNVVKIVKTEMQKEKLISDGFKLMEEKEPSDSNGKVNYSEMTIQDLQALCKDKGLSGYSNLSKDELVKFVEDKLSTLGK